MVLQLLHSGFGLFAFFAPGFITWVLGMGLLSRGGGSGGKEENYKLGPKRALVHILHSQEGISIPFTRMVCKNSEAKPKNNVLLVDLEWAERVANF